MKRQAGNELYVAAAAVLVLVLIVAGFLWYVGKERAEAFVEGVTAERGRWEARESEELRMANAALVAEQAKRRAIEIQAAQDLVALDEENLEEVRRVETDKNRFIADVRSGRVRLLDDIATAGEAAGCPGGAAPSAAAGERDGEARGELLETLRSRVVAGAELAAEADKVVAQLTAAQGVIEAYRKACR